MYYCSFANAYVSNLLHVVQYVSQAWCEYDMLAFSIVLERPWMEVIVWYLFNTTTHISFPLPPAALKPNSPPQPDLTPRLHTRGHAHSAHTRTDDLHRLSPPLPHSPLELCDTNLMPRRRRRYAIHVGARADEQRCGDARAGPAKVVGERVKEGVHELCVWLRVRRRGRGEEGGTGGVVRPAKHHSDFSCGRAGVLRRQSTRVEDGAEHAEGVLARGVCVGGRGRGGARDEVAEAGRVQRGGRAGEEEVHDGDGGGGRGGEVWEARE